MEKPEYYTYDHTDDALDESATIYYGNLPGRGTALDSAGDAWLKMSDLELVEGETFWDSESRASIPVQIRKPGEHPGLPGYYWIDPAVTVYGVGLSWEEEANDRLLLEADGGKREPGQGVGEIWPEGDTI